MPKELVSLLKTNLKVTNSAAPVFDQLKSNRGLMILLEKTFKEFDDGRGIEKVIVALGWAHFRDRFASLYVFKTIYGHFPVKTDMTLVEDIKNIENLYDNYSVPSYSRLFLLGFYLNIANIEVRHKEGQSNVPLQLPTDITDVLKHSLVRSERIDWLILVVWHFTSYLGKDGMIKRLQNDVHFSEIYKELTDEQQTHFTHNLLTYGASILEDEVFFYERV